MVNTAEEIERNKGVRKVILEYLDWVSSYDEQRQYQAAVPNGVHVPHEAINQWADWVRDEWWDLYVPPVFSINEQRAMRDYHRVWNEVIEATPNPLPSLEELIGTEEWERLRSAAERARRAFSSHAPGLRRDTNAT
ncbi:hypothetical protein [Mesorhizobium amorphae]|uniref:hypothetical protein n=1 Tax=Mesorhizobium amorphae TaxID=71433 RepID=UPI00118427EE|nr:hypothetical protein [Mesorhizobium amorphae]